MTADVEPADIAATWALDDYDPATLKLWWSSSCTGKSSDTHAPNDLLPRPHTKVWGCRSGKGTVHLTYGGKSIGHIEITVLTATPTPTNTPITPTIEPTAAPITPPTKGPTAPPTPSATPPAVSGLTAEGKATDVTLGWTHSAGIKRYEISYSGTNSASGSSSRLIEGSESSATISVGCGVTRQFEIRASGDGITYQEAWGPWSASVSATTKACTPTPTPGDPPDPPTSTPTPSPTPVPASVKITHVIPGTEGAHVAVQWSPSRPTDVSNLTLEWETVNKDCRYLLVVPVVCKGSAKLAHNGAAWVVDGKFKPGIPYHKFKIKAKRSESKDIEGWFKDSNGNHNVVTTHPHADIGVVSVFGEPADQKVEDTDQSVFTYFTVQLLVPQVVLDDVNSLDYKVSMNVPTGTGLQLKKSKRESCSYGSQSPAQWTWLTNTNTKYYFVRCSLGDGATDLTLNAKVLRGGNEYPVGTYARVEKVPQSTHQKDNSVTYHVRGSSGKTITFVEDGQQEGMFPTPPSDPNFKMPPSTPFIDPAVYVKAAAVWHDLGAGVTVNKAAKNSFEVEIRGYWGDNDKICPQTVACVRASTADYPHEDQSQTMWFENSPQWSKNATVREWTSSFSKWRTNKDYYLYLPAFLVHELGHSLGFENSNEGPSIMNQGIHIPCGPDIAKCLTDTDKKGLKAIYQSHNSHE